MEPESLKWAATLRLTPELLAKIQRNDDDDKNTAVSSLSMSIRLASDKSETSVLRVGDEEFELLAYSEDPAVNHLVTLTNAGSSSTQKGGFSFHETGRIAKKLIVQRMLDGQEQLRLKDRHAKSVVESKSRTSKLLDVNPPTKAVRKRTTRLVCPRRPTPFSFSSTSSSIEIDAEPQRSQKRYKGALCVA